ncbi:hypothetical protein WJX73_002304 [Symbiochloris irregularis]|uniref:Hedgehog protein Hint domain-containing protein n=1 Tax=Symbiochloris irregularis TaxID=706552 RepID=A0AAW1NLZ6_9CHLO
MEGRNWMAVTAAVLCLATDLAFSVNGSSLQLVPVNVASSADCSSDATAPIILSFVGSPNTATQATITIAEGNIEVQAGTGGTVVLNITSTTTEGSSSVTCTATYKVQSGTILGVSSSSSSSGTGSSKSSCFPASAVVSTPAGQKLMRNLRLGDEVLVGGPATAPHFEKIFLWSHRDASARATFVEIETASGSTLHLTAGHYLF